MVWVTSRRRSRTTQVILQNAGGKGWRQLRDVEGGKGSIPSRDLLRTKRTWRLSTATAPLRCTFRVCSCAPQVHVDVQTPSKVDSLGANHSTRDLLAWPSFLSLWSALRHALRPHPSPYTLTYPLP